ncbi:MAG: DMT family transporter [Acidimicrobiia bacterium]
MPWLAALLALGASALFAVGAVAQQQAAATNVDARGIRFLFRLLASPRWIAATFGNVLGYALQACALAAGSLLVVQPILVTTLVFALPLGARWNHRHITRHEIVWAGALCAALATFILASHADGGVDVTSFRGWRSSLVACGGVVLVLGTVATLSTGRRRSISFAVVAGTCVGFASALTKSVVHILGQHPESVVRHWEFYALLASGALGVFTQQLAFQAGSLEISFPATMILDPVVSVLVGVDALRERIDASTTEWVLIAASVAVLVAGTIALARAAAPTRAPLADPVPAGIPPT